jgi:hypothetical protein
MRESRRTKAVERLERLQLPVAFNDLNEAKRLNGWNVLNRLRFYSDMSGGQDASSLP